MARWSLRQVFALLLAVFVTVGLSVSVVQASNMAVNMAMSSDMGVSAHHECHDCDGDTGKTRSMVCTVTCVAPVSADLPHVGPVSLVTIPTKPVLRRATVLHGSTSPPDPYPPRTSDIG